MEMAEDHAAGSGAVTVGAKRKWFTVKEANRSLPLVSRIVADVVTQHEHLEQLRKSRASLLAEGRRGPAQQIERQAIEVVARLNNLIQELSNIGCDLRDLLGGLVDFPGRRKGKAILLCWKPGEEQVGYWHEPHAGFIGRRPIDEACE
jgi:hypothetical protein